MLGFMMCVVRERVILMCCTVRVDMCFGYVLYGVCVLNVYVLRGGFSPAWPTINL